MMVVPELAPALVPPDGAYGDVARLWIEFMGGTIFLIGSGYTAKCLAAALPKPVVRPGAQIPAEARARTRAALPADGKRAAV